MRSNNIRVSVKSRFYFLFSLKNVALCKQSKIIRIKGFK